MFLLDTDLISHTTKAVPHPGALRWLAQVPDETTVLSVVCLQEIQNGVELLPLGRKRRELESWLESTILPAFATRVFKIDEPVVRESGRLMAAARKARFEPELGDSLIAATARVRGLSGATLNGKHYAQLKVEMVEF
jgi:predicted nucleic acid-binding protein